MKKTPRHDPARQPVAQTASGDNPYTPGMPLSWPEHFPPTDRWQKFFIGLRGLGPDISFFKELKQRQAVRTELAMAAWTDPQQRRVAETLGRCLQRELEWKTPWFLPNDTAEAVLGSPSFDTWNELDYWDVYVELDNEVGTKRGPEFWNSLVNWNNKTMTFGELVGKILPYLCRGTG
jgi:hypothetical protein